MIQVRVQAEDFSVEAEYQRLRQAHSEAGAVAVFVGLVRDRNLGTTVSQLHLEHYPGMTERTIEQFAETAAQRWPVLDITIIHRVGTLSVQDQIVFVGVSGEHRAAAFEVCDYLMDYLKSQAPLWKKERCKKTFCKKESGQKEHRGSTDCRAEETEADSWEERWIEPVEKDQLSLQRWNNAASADKV